MHTSFFPPVNCVRHVVLAGVLLFPRRLAGPPRPVWMLFSLTLVKLPVDPLNALLEEEEKTLALPLRFFFLKILWIIDEPL